MDQDTVDLVSHLYSELRSTKATFGEGAIERLVPHISAVMTKLNDLTKYSSELAEEVELLRDNLLSAEHRCMSLNDSYKGKTAECCEIEEQSDAEIQQLRAQLAKCKEENASLQQRIDCSGALETDRLITESRDKIATLTVERQCLLTSIEVLEADIKCLRSELRRAESRVRRQRASVEDSLLAELTLAESAAASSFAPGTPNPAPSFQLDANDANGYISPNSCAPATPPSPPQQDGTDFRNVLVIGDSHLRHSGKRCVNRGAYLECCPGGKIADIKARLLSYIGIRLDVIYFHVGANNLRKGYRGGPGYNGGHGKRQALHDMADLLYTAKTNFPNSKIFLDSVLIRRDIGYRALYDFNDQLELMSNNFGVEFIEANTCVTRRDLARDGVHFNRRAVSRLGSLFVDAITAALQSLDAETISVPGALGDATSVVGRSLGARDTVGNNHIPRESSGDSRVSGD